MTNSIRVQPLSVPESGMFFTKQSKKNYGSFEERFFTHLVVSNDPPIQDLFLEYNLTIKIDQIFLIKGIFTRCHLNEYLTMNGWHFENDELDMIRSNFNKFLILQCFYLENNKKFIINYLNKSFSRLTYEDVKLTVESFYFQTTPSVYNLITDYMDFLYNITFNTSDKVRKFCDKPERRFLNKQFDLIPDGFLSDWEIALRKKKFNSKVLDIVLLTLGYHEEYEQQLVDFFDKIPNSNLADCLRFRIAIFKIPTKPELANELFSSIKNMEYLKNTEIYKQSITPFALNEDNSNHKS